MRAVTVTALLAAALALGGWQAGPASAQGSTGGSLGKKGKSVSGGGAAMRNAAPARKSSPPAGVSGRWLWNAKCNTGNWSAGFHLNMDGASSFIGTFVNDSGSITNGRLTGNRISFQRNHWLETQLWSARLSDNRRRMSGTIGGPISSCSFSASKQ